MPDGASTPSAITDATWGVDRLGADWDEHTAKCAKNCTSFSHSGPIDQLVFEGLAAE